MRAKISAFAKKILIGKNGKIRLCWRVSGISISTYLLIFGLVLPFALRPAAESQISKSLNSTCTIEKIRFNPFTLNLYIYNLDIKYPNGNDFLHAEKVIARPGVELFLLTPSLGRLCIVKPDMHLAIREDGTLSLNDFITPQSLEQKEKDEESGGILSFVLKDFSIENGSLEFYDAIRSSTQHINEIHLTAPFTSSRAKDQEKGIEPELRAVVNGRPIIMTGNTRPFSQNLRTEFNIELDAITLEQFNTYLSPFTTLELENGALSAKLSLILERAEEQGVMLLARGDFSLTNMVFVETLQDNTSKLPVLSLKNGTVVLERLLTGSNTSLMLETVALDTPEMYLQRGRDNTINWQKYIKPQVKKETTQTQETSAKLNPALITPKKTGQEAESTTTSSAAAGSESVLQPQDAQPDAGSESVTQDQASSLQNMSALSTGGIFIKHLTIGNGIINWRDESMSPPYEQKIYKIALSLSQTSIDAQGNGSYGSSLEFKDGGNLMLYGTWRINPVDVKIEILSQELPLLIANPYMLHFAGIDLGTGKISSANGQLYLKQNSNGQINFSLQKGGLLIENLSMRQLFAGKLASKPALSLSHLEIKDINADDYSKKASISAIAMSGLSASILRDTSGNILLKNSQDIGTTSKLSPAPSKAAPPPANIQASQETGQKNWQFELASLKLFKSHVEFHDFAVAGSGKGVTPQAIILDGVEIALSGASSDLTKPITISATGSVFGSTLKRPTGEGKFNVAGKVTLDPVNIELNAKTERIALQSFSQYWKPVSRMKIAGGNFGSDLNIKLALPKTPGKAAPAIRLNGDITIAGLSMLDEGKEILGWGIMRSKGINYSTKPGSNGELDIKTFELAGSRASFAIHPDGQSNFAKAFYAKPPADVPDQAIVQPDNQTDNNANRLATRVIGSLPPIPRDVADSVMGGMSSITIDNAAISNGTVKFNDMRPETIFAIELKDLQGKFSSFSSAPETQGNIELTAMLDSAPVSITGTGNFLRSPFSLNSSLKMEGLDMPPLTPYSIKYIAYPILRGKLYFNADISLNNENLLAKNNIRFFRLELGEQLDRPDAPGAPIKFGLSLLEDSNHNININLPMSGQLNDPKFASGGLVARLIGNLILSIVSSPFSLVGSIFSGDSSEDLEYIYFARGDDRLDQSARESITAIVELMRQKPKLSLDITGMASPSEADAIADVELMKVMQEAKFRSMPRSERKNLTTNEMKLGPDININEYHDILLEAYEDSKYRQNKIDKNIPITTDSMLSDIRKNRNLTSEELREVSITRAKVVRDYMLQLDKTLGERIHLSEPIVGSESARVKMGGSF